MPSVSSPLMLTAADAERARELRRVKAVATSVLVLTFVVFVGARVLIHVHPAMGFVAAFAEAATIGGLADWYAVVALFRRPLGLPIPHTAIIQSNQHRIADKLGDFIETHFLGAAPVEAKLRQIDFAAFIADWLCDARRSADLARFALRLLPDALDAAETSQLKSFVARRIATQLQAIDLAPLAAGTLRAFIAQGKHQALLDDLLAGIDTALTKTETVAAIRDKIRNELPTLLRLYRTDAFLVKKIVASATAFFADVRTDPAHPFRGEFDAMVLKFADRLADDPAMAGKIDALKSDLLARPELAAMAARLWRGARDYISASAAGEDSVLQRHLAGVFVEAGRALKADAPMRADINHGIVAVSRSFIADQKSGVSGFIADQVKAWDMRQLIGVIEVNIGRDLQYIRFNGALIGGLAGLALHALEVLLRLP